MNEVIEHSIDIYLNSDIICDKASSEQMFWYAEFNVPIARGISIHTPTLS